MKLLLSLNALLPSQYRDIVRGWDKTRYLDLFKFFSKKKGITTDKNMYRMYLPLTGIRVEAPPAIQQEVKRNGGKILDYVTGVGIDKYGRTVKLSKLISRSLLTTKLQKDLRDFAAKKPRLLVISRHPYDIAGMSTGRGWTSCMNLRSGEYAEKVPHAAKWALIAYLISPEDKDIKNPGARIMIQPYFRPNVVPNVSGKPRDVALVPSMVYGTGSYNFLPSVQKWTKIANKYLGVVGYYRALEDSYIEDSRDFVQGKMQEHDILARLIVNPQFIKKIRKPTPTMVRVTLLHDIENAEGFNDFERNQGYTLLPYLMYKGIPVDKDIIMTIAEKGDPRTVALTYKLIKNPDYDILNLCVEKDASCVEAYLNNRKWKFTDDDVKLIAKALGPNERKLWSYIDQWINYKKFSLKQLQLLFSLVIQKNQYKHNLEFLARFLKTAKLFTPGYVSTLLKTPEDLLKLIPLGLTYVLVQPYVTKRFYEQNKNNIGGIVSVITLLYVQYPLEQKFKSFAPIFQPFLEELKQHPVGVKYLPTLGLTI